jgi:hypothetical protein
MGPIGPGTAFETTWIAGDPMTVEYRHFEPTSAWTTVGRSRRLHARTEGGIAPTELGSLGVVMTALRPKGPWRSRSPRSVG